MSSSGKTQHFDCCIRWFESNYPSQKKARSKERAFFNEICPSGKWNSCAVKYLLRKCEIFADANVGKFHFTLRPNRCEATGSNISQCAIAHYFTFGWGRIFHSFLPTEPKLWADSNRHTVGDDLPGVPNNSTQTGRRGRRPLQFKIIYKAIDAKAFWIDSDLRNAWNVYKIVV